MPRSKSCETSAEKQRAYRLRKQGLELVEKEPKADDAVLGARDVAKCADIPPTEDMPLARPPTEEESKERHVWHPGVVGEPSPERKETLLSKTDQAFEEDRPGWYIFEKETKKRECWKCGKQFKTQLEMNKFCSPECKNEYLDSTSLRGAK